MADCEICGRSGAGEEVLVEGSRLVVCRLCSSLGRSLSRKPAVLASSVRQVRMPEGMEIEPRADITELVRKGREKLGLTQEQLSGRLKLPANTIKRIENGWTPPLETLKKLEVVTKISMIENAGSAAELRKKLEKKMLTIGDVVNVRD